MTGAAQAQKLELVIQTGSFSFVDEVVFSPDNSIMAIGSRNEIKLINVESGRELRTIIANTTGLTNLKFSSDGKLLTANWGTLKIWKVATGEPLSDIPIKSVDSQTKFSKDGKLFAIYGLRSGTLKNPKHIVEIWSLEKNKFESLIEVENESIDSAFSSNNQKLVTIDSQRVTNIWNIKSKEAIGWRS